MNNKPSWKKGDIIVLLGNYGGVLSIFEAELNPQFFSSQKNWYYGLTDCEELRPATIDDIDLEIKFQKEKVKREQLRLDKLLNFRERLDNNNTGAI